jgi:three-Cys-motif partner protein
MTSDHRFGGDWTSEKLAILAKYLSAYTTALKNQRQFTKGYIDAFAGTGYRTNKSRGTKTPSLFDNFPDLAGDDTKTLLDGSARIALKTEPAFDGFIFIEKNKRRSDALEALKEEFRELNIQIRPGEANDELRRICRRTDWRTRRAVLFLDPYGMQVEWETILAVAATHAIDMWLLFPLGIGVNRLVTKDGNIPAAWRRRLDLLLGTDEWFDEFYKSEKSPSLFDGPDGPSERLVKAKVDTIAHYFTRRLREVFPAVALSPRALRNSQGNPMYLLHFASGNAGQGGKTAVKIANSLLKSAG